MRKSAFFSNVKLCVGVCLEAVAMLSSHCNAVLSTIGVAVAASAAGLFGGALVFLSLAY